MIMILLDTNIIIDHLRLERSVPSALVKVVKNCPDEDFLLSVISVTELYEGKSTRKKSEEQRLLSVISPLRIAPYTFAIAQLSGQIMRDNWRPIELADAAIAATAIVNRAKLYTANKKDFVGIKGLEFWVISK